MNKRPKKECTACQTEQPLASFRRDKRAADGRGAVCVQCNRKAAQKYRNAHLDAASARIAGWKKENPKKYILWRAQQRARQNGIEFRLQETDLTLPEKCPLLGIPLNYDARKGDTSAASLDRIDSTKGYIPGNVQVVSWRANTIKSNATPDELRRIAAAVHADRVVPVLPLDANTRNQIPMCDGLLDYFPLALAEVSKVSFVGNQQHNPGEVMHWARMKSRDHANKIVKHLIDRGTVDTDGMRHSAKIAWRALALLQEEIEQVTAAPSGRASKW